MSKTDARSEVLSDSVRGIFLSNQHRIWVRTDSRGIINTAGQLVYCSWATSSCSSLVTGSASGRSVSLKTVYFLMHLGEQVLQRQTFNPSDTAMFLFFEHLPPLYYKI